VIVAVLLLVQAWGIVPHRVRRVEKRGMRGEVHTVRLVSTFWQVLVHVEGTEFGSIIEGLSWRASKPVNISGEECASTGEMKMNESSRAMSNEYIPGSAKRKKMVVTIEKATIVDAD